MSAVATWFSGLLQKELRSWLVLEEHQISRLWNHYEILLQWNEKMNLTSITPGEEMVVRHYCESLFFAARLPAKSEAIRVLDLGSGAGFPGFPMAVLKPTWSVTLLESNQRKAVFLRDSTRNISNIRVLAKRADAVTESFDWLVSRGVDPTEVLKNIPRLASSIGLMLGKEDLRDIQIHPGMAWDKPVQLPWGDRRICAYGVFHVEPPL